VFDYNAFDDHTILESNVLVPIGTADLTVKVRRTGGRTGTAALEIDGNPCGNVELPLFMLMMSSVGPSVGYDHGSAVSSRYRAPYGFTGKLHEVVIQASPERFADAASAEAAVEMGRQ
jgi:hypothetical protein